MNATTATSNANFFSTVRRLWRAAMKHWRPELDEATTVPAGRSKSRRDWSSVLSYVPPRRMPQRKDEYRPATFVGLGMVAAGCLVVGIFAYTVLAPPHAVDRSVRVTATR